MESSSRKASGSLYAGEKGGEEDGVNGVVGKAAELWSAKEVWCEWF